MGKVDQKVVVEGEQVTFMGRPVRSPLPVNLKSIYRFARRVKINKATGCWEWTGGRNYNYGVFWLNGENNPAHRVSYLLIAGDIPERHHIHHECNNRRCVNPDHLTCVTPRDHVLEHTPDAITYINRRKTHCIRGHELSGRNLLLGNDGKRHCRQCKDDWGMRKRRQLRAENPLPEKTECSRGHAWIPENWIEYRGRKQCKICKQITLAAFKQRIAESGVPYAPKKDRTHCKAGHELKPENTAYSRGVKICRICMRAKYKARQEAKRNQIAA